jgi:tetratricopeptide (TPR) repeat protein/outer membrane protein OmpA-like peptidoglycan-associated protein
LRYLFIAISILLAIPSFGQSPDQYVARGDKELFDGFPESALFYYKLAMKQDTNMVEANFKAGEAYRAQRNYKRAAKFYDATAGLDEQDEFPEVLYWLGVMQKQQGKYKEAKHSLTAFLAIYRLRDDFYRNARDEQISCDWAIDHITDEPFYKVDRPDSGLNSVHAEMSPFLVDSSTMYFATMRYETDEVKKSKSVFVEMKKAIKDSNVWELQELDLPIASQNAHVGNGCFSADSSRFYYSNCPNPSYCSIYQVNRNGKTWSEPIKLGSPINESGSSNTQPMAAVYDDMEYLYFASDRSNGKGGYDIWFTEIKDGKPTARLKNMGTRINTKGNEITPWFDSSDTTFYFSSNKQMGFGGYDIFKSKGEPGRFNTVENAGTEVNSPADDYYFAFRKKDSVGYFASNRISGLKKSGNETCCNDLYKVQIVPIIDTIPEEDTEQIDTILAVVIDLGQIAQVDTLNDSVDVFDIPETIEEVQDLLPISLYFHNDRPNPRTLATTTELSYTETVEDYLRMQEEYLSVISNSEIPDSAQTAMYNTTKAFFQKDLRGSVARIDAALNVLLSELEKGSDVTIAVKGYASPLANSDYNLNLTYRRIDAMENYIKTYNRGAFVKHLNQSSENGKLTIEKIPYGESKAAANISDSGNDKLSAIYSPSAAQERRIEILRVERTE